MFLTAIYCVYLDMMKADPKAMTKALGIHNRIIRNAGNANAGNILEQEGDSYTVVFHDAFDAVVFCLQVCVITDKMVCMQTSSVSGSVCLSSNWLLTQLSCVVVHTGCSLCC